MFKVHASFMGSFKTGDNINYNLECLKLLYKLRDGLSESEAKLLNKSILLHNVSIIEAVLHDFHMRMRSYTREGVVNVTADVLASIRSKKIDELAKYIASAKKHDFFEMKDTAFYEALDLLRKSRNRVHIQNANGDLDPNEKAVFTDRSRELSERALEKVLKIMEKKYSRGHHSVADFELPWDPWFDESGMKNARVFK